MKDHTYCKYVLTLITCILQTCYTVNGQDRWSLITSCDLCDGYNAVAYGNGQWVIVGDYGRVLTSTDAVVWVSQKSNTTQNLNDVVYAAGRWLCVGTNGVVLTSPDGATWSTYNTDPANRFDGVAYGGGLWIAVGRTNNVRVGYGVLFTSTDGITWADQPAAHQLSYGLNKVRYLNGKWYVVGGNGVIATSSTGTNWTVGNSGTVNSLNSIAYGGGKFMISTEEGNIVSSSNGINWSVWRVSTSPIKDVSYGNGYWVAVNNIVYGQTIIYNSSNDGLNWIPVASPATNNLYSVLYSNGRWVAVGRLFAILTSPVLIATPLSVLPRSDLVSVYPNPSITSATVQSGDYIQKITIRSVDGVVLEEHIFKSPTKHWQWDNTAIPSGLYYIQIYTSDQTMSTIKHVKR